MNIVYLKEDETINKRSQIVKKKNKRVLPTGQSYIKKKGNTNKYFKTIKSI